MSIMQKKVHNTDTKNRKVVRWEGHNLLPTYATQEIMGESLKGRAHTNAALSFFYALAVGFAARG